MTSSRTLMMLEERSGYWRERIAEQERSALPVQEFCKERGLDRTDLLSVEQTAPQTRADAVRTGGNRHGSVGGPKAGLELALVTARQFRRVALGGKES